MTPCLILISELLIYSIFKGIATDRTALIIRKKFQINSRKTVNFRPADNINYDIRKTIIIILSQLSSLNTLLYCNNAIVFSRNSCKNVRVQPIPKKGSKTHAFNYRSIALVSTIRKVLAKISNSEILKYLGHNNLRHHMQ